MADTEVAAELVALFEAKVKTADGRIRVEDLLSAAAAATGEACIVAAGEFDPQRHTFTPGSVVMSDRMNGILADDSADWAGAGASVLGIIATGGLAAGYSEADLPSLANVFRGFAAGVGGGGSATWGFVPLSVPEENRPFVQPLRQSYELRPGVRAILGRHKVPMSGWPRACAFALVAELGRVRDAIDHGVALRIVLETVNGRAKTAPMTDEAMRQAR